MSRARNWSWTLFPKDDAHIAQLKVKLEQETSYSVFGIETCPNTSKRHLQGYSHLKNAKTLSAFKKLTDKTMHLEQSLGSAESNLHYCSKGEQPKEEWEESKEIGPNYGKNAIVWQCGTMPQSGTRTDIHELRDACVNAVALSDIITENDVLVPLAKYQRFAQMVHTSALKERTRAFRKLQVIVHWGKTGTNKTRIPYDEGAYVWEPSTPEWWDGYDGESILLIDEFYGQLKPARLLHLLDGYQLRLPIKGGFTYAQWTKVYITSNVPPEEWYTNIPEQVKEALARRITEVKQFKKRELTP